MDKKFDEFGAEVMISAMDRMYGKTMVDMMEMEERLDNEIGKLEKHCFA